jgi:aspartate/methionine/tyrosine aminotransferase
MRPPVATRAPHVGLSAGRHTEPLGLDLGRARASGIERWFSVNGRPAPFDLARSGAPALTVGDLLARASPADITEYLGMPLDYGPGTGSERLRHAVAQAVGATAEEVIITHGAIEALLLAFAASIGRRRAVAVATPGYEGLVRAVEAAGGHAHPVAVWAPGRDELDLAPLADLDLRSFAAVVVNSPHNPTGLRAAAVELEDLARRCEAAGTVFVVDQVSLGTLDPGATGVTRTLPDDVSSVVEIGDVSKALGLGGLRVGWCVTRCPRRRRRIAALRDVTSLANSGPSQLLGALAIENRHQFSIAIVASANVERLRTAVTSIPGVTWTEPEDGLVTFPALPLHCSSLGFAEQLCHTEGVSVTPGSFFGHEHHLRIGLGLDPQLFAEGVERLVSALTAWTGHDR